ncbi:MAG: S9 family peptidase [Acidobacteria bacterium]|nr:MAG: S9 family peptidase [Acidobacteriota bacterium]
MKRRAFPLLLLAGFLAATSALSQETKTSRQAVEKRLHDVEKEKVSPAIEQAIHSLAAASGFTQAVVSPDGKKVAWVEELRDKNGAESGNSLIFTTTSDGKGPARKITASSGTPRAESDITWSPDSRGFAFLSDAAKPGQLQLYLQSAPGQPAKRLTNVKGFLASPKFSPDGKTIAVLFTENATRAAGPLVAETPETGEIKDAFFEQRLALIDIATGKLRQVSPADTYIYEYDWAPDDLHLVVTSALGNGDNNWWIADLSILDATSGLMKSIYKPELQINFPAWSPDGKSIAFIEGLMSDFGSIGGDIFLMPATGEKPQNLTPERKASISWLTWTKDGKIIAGEYTQGDSSVISLDPSTSKIDSLYRAEDLVSTGTWGPAVSVSDDGKISAAVRRSFSAAPEIWAGPIGNWKQITQRNKGVTPAWGQAKSIRWKSDSYDVQGWLIYPANFDSSKKYPMVVEVHGGPSAAVLSAWPGSGDFALALAASGYFVLTGVDEALKTAPIDSNRLGITGWSYGGYMTMWAVTQTNRFKAAMAGAGIANYQSYYGENKIDQWMVPFFGKSVYDDPDVYAKSSPITFIKKAKTPTLVIVGDSDGECPTPQSYEFWHALKTLGVETQLVVYEHEGHHFAKPEHQRDRIRRTVAWFDAHLLQP